MKQIPLNTDVDGNCSCLKANYFKMGGANFIGHTSDGFKATCVMEIIERDTPMKGNYKEPRICTMVGRGPNNPSSRVRSDHYEQFLEMGDDVSNTLTSVQKDNLVAEPRPIIIDDYNQRIPQDQDVIGTITTNIGNSAPRHGFKIAEPLCIPQATKQGYIEVPPGSVFDASYPDSKTRRGRVQEGGQVSPTLMAGGEAPCYYEGVEAKVFKEGNYHKSGHNASSIVNPKGLSPTVMENHGTVTATIEPMSYRIRKLTPRECFRLMGVSETDIDKIQSSGVSRSQQYKMAGNSIVVDVLEHIFRKMFVNTGQESQQLSLF